MGVIFLAELIMANKRNNPEEDALFTPFLLVQFLLIFALNTLYSSLHVYYEQREELWGKVYLQGKGAHLCIRETYLVPPRGASMVLEVEVTGTVVEARGWRGVIGLTPTLTAPSLTSTSSDDFTAFFFNPSANDEPVVCSFDSLLLLLSFF